MEHIFIILSWAILLVSGFDDSDPPTGDRTFKIEYSDFVQSIKTTSDETLDFWGFEIELKQNSTGILDIKVPKNFPTPASFTDSWNFNERPVVVGDNKEIDYDFVKEPCFIHYKIPVEGETNVEIAFPIILAGRYQLYSSTQFDEDDPCYNRVFYVPAVEPPLKQFKSRGVSIEDVICKPDLVLIGKYKDATPACLKPETAASLIKSGWGRLVITSDYDIAGKDCGTSYQLVYPYDSAEKFRSNSLDYLKFHFSQLDNFKEKFGPNWWDDIRISDTIWKGVFLVDFPIIMEYESDERHYIDELFYREFRYTTDQYTELRPQYFGIYCNK